MPLSDSILDWQNFETLDAKMMTSGENKLRLGGWGCGFTILCDGVNAISLDLFY